MLRALKCIENTTISAIERLGKSGFFSLFLALEEENGVRGAGSAGGEPRPKGCQSRVTEEAQARESAPGVCHSGEVLPAQSSLKEEMLNPPCTLR